MKDETNVRWISIADFLALYFAGAKRPSPRTIQRQIRDGIIPGHKIGKGGRYYIDLKQYLEMTGNPLVDSVLRRSDKDQK